MAPTLADFAGRFLLGGGGGGGFLRLGACSLSAILPSVAVGREIGDGAMSEGGRTTGVAVAGGAGNRESKLSAEPALASCFNG
jgi:hypothetical protein